MGYRKVMPLDWPGVNQEAMTALDKHAYLTLTTAFHWWFYLDRIWVIWLSGSVVCVRMNLLAVSYVVRSPRFTSAALCTLGIEPFHSPLTPPLARIWEKASHVPRTLKKIMPYNWELIFFNTLRTGDEDSRHLRFCVINVEDGWRKIAFQYALVFYALNYAIHGAYIKWSSGPDLEKNCDFTLN
jgi:hypothetical protein